MCLIIYTLYKYDFVFFFSQGAGIMILVKAGVIKEVFGEGVLDKQKSNILQVKKSVLDFLKNLILTKQNSTMIKLSI